MKLHPKTIPDIKRLEESPIVVDGQNVGWHVSAIGSKGALGGGLSTELETAKRIAIAETIEREVVRQINDSDLKSLFMLDKYPTSCGFAAGFESKATRLRAISEAVERWAWSKWIDDGFLLPSLKVTRNELQPLERYFFDSFDEVLFYSITIKTELIPNFLPAVEFGVVLGVKGSGVFPGSRIATRKSDLWQHSLIEAWRHMHIFGQNLNREQLEFPVDRIVFFGKNCQSALFQIESAKNDDWPKPEQLLVKQFKTQDENVFVWRSLMKDYVGWEKNNKTRFVY